jgi:insulysin
MKENYDGKGNIINTDSSNMHQILESISPYIKKINGVYVPKNDKFIYKILTLENKLQIFFVQNEESNISSASMYVGVGNIDNPKDIPGMAHYLEHMLFMGSDMYPGGTFFQSQVMNNGGSTNAYTTDNHTNFFFDVSDNFLNVLKIFSRFFINPLFDVKYVEKEVSAVDSEHNKNIGSDDWRIINLFGRFFTDGINNQFSTGNRETLLGSVIDNDPNILRDRLIEFYQSHYSSDRMILFISSNMIDTSFIDAIKNMFEKVVLRKTSITDDTAQVKILESSYEMIRVKTIRDTKYLMIYWLIDGTEKYRNNICADGYGVLSYILGHEGEKSLYQILLMSGLAVDILSGVESNHLRNSMFKVQIKLTQHGFDNINVVLYIVNEYIHKLDINSNDLFNVFYDELKLLNILHTKTIDNVDGLSLCQHYINVYNTTKIDLKYLPIANLLSDPLSSNSTSGRLTNRDMCENHFKNALKSMNMNNAKVIVSSSSYDKLELSQTDSLYGTHFEHTDIPIALDIKKLSSTLNFESPETNILLNRVGDINIINTIDSDDDTYCLIHSNNDGNIYYVKKKNTYDTYSVCGMISIKLESMSTYDPDVYIALQLYCAYIQKKNHAKIFMLNTIGVSINVMIDKCGLVILIDWFNSCISLNTIFKDVIGWYWNKENEMSDQTIDNNIYKMIYNDIKSGLINYQSIDAYMMAGREFKHMINKYHTITNEQMLKSIIKFDPNSFKSILKFKNNCVDLLSTGNIVGVFGGSIDLKQVMQIISILDTTIVKPETTLNKVYDIDSKHLKQNVIKYNMNPSNNEKAIAYGLFIENLPEISNSGWETKNPLCMLLESYISEKFSSNIRTENEVGYIASCNVMNVTEGKNPYFFLVFIVQSSKDGLEGIVKKYIDQHMMQDVNIITDDEFKTMKQSIVVNLQEKPLNIAADCSEKFSILNSTYDNPGNKADKIIKLFADRFNRKKKIIHGIDQINKNNFVNFVKDIITKNVCSVLLVEPSKANH